MLTKQYTLTYDLINPLTKAHVSCSKKYLLNWIARGFIIKEIKRNLDDGNQSFRSIYK